MTRLELGEYRIGNQIPKPGTEKCQVNLPLLFVRLSVEFLLGISGLVLLLDVLV